MFWQAVVVIVGSGGMLAVTAAVDVAAVRSAIPRQREGAQRLGLTLSIVSMTVMVVGAVATMWTDLMASSHSTGSALQMVESGVIGVGLLMFVAGVLVWKYADSREQEQ